MLTVADFDEKVCMGGWAIIGTVFLRNMAVKAADDGCTSI